MNYGGNMPDWHQYNASQTNEVTPQAQNVNSGRLGFIPGVSPQSLNALSLSSEGLNKHQSNSNYNPRNYQTLNNVPSGPNIPNNGPLASMVQMQNCISHYGSSNTRNPMLDNLNTSVDPRNSTIGAINDDLGYRSNQVPFNGPIGHLNGPNCNLNVSSGSGPGPGVRTNTGPGPGNSPGTGTASGSMFGPGSRHGPVPGPGPGSGSGPTNMGPQNTNIGSVPHGKPGPSSFIPCKGMCCNSDPNINYQQWEKFGSYQNNTSYRDNVHPSSYQMENRHFGNNCNFRKDSLESKEVMGPVLPNATAVDHRRNFPDYKYHKDHLVHRNYSASSGMYHNYPTQNYNYSMEHQKYPYPVKEHPKPNNMNISNPGMIKHQEQNFIAQQKYNNKQYQYQNGSILPKGVPTMNVNTNMASSPQNPYYNSQFTRNVPTEMSHECHETTDNGAVVNRMQGTFMHGSPPQHQHQLYQHKISIQKFSMENHLRELSRIPGYHSHPKYKECVLKYRELLKLQQSIGYQNPVQQTSRVPTPVSNAIPINLQFDQNGMLINSNYIPDTFPKLPHIQPTEQPAESLEKQSKEQPVVMPSEKRHQPQQPTQMMISPQNENVPSSCAEPVYQKQNQYTMHKDFNQNQLKVRTDEGHNFNTLSPETSNEAMIQQKGSKEFANKPDLDVRQFLANWDETDDEEGTTSNLPHNILSETTPVVVVSYENVDLSSKTPPGAEVQSRSNFCSNETLNNEKQGEANVIAAQDCLTISYSSPEDGEIAKAPKQTITEGVVKPGSIIHCISNGPDEIPTIHIVDSLGISNIVETTEGQVIETLEKQKTISFFTETANSETEAVPLETSEESLDNVNKNVEDSRMSETIQTTGVSATNQELKALSTSTKSTLDVAENLELKKQSSFASEESHNQDDISLPDLPTSECTPISTTLNTPIHSDNEESTENMEDLTISANPIEVMQNSPVISFTQSPVKMEPYGQLSEDKLRNRSLSTLDLEFQKDSRYKNNDANSEQDVTLNDFDFSAGNSKAKSAEAKVSETCAALTSIGYQLEVQQEAAKAGKSPECESPKRKVVKSVSRSGDSNVTSGTRESDDEAHTSKRQRTKSLNISINAANPTPSETDINPERRRLKENIWDDKCVEKYLDSEKSTKVQKKDAEHSRQSKKFPGDESSSPHSGEHFVCHMSSQYKNYSVAVIKDNVNVSDKKSRGTTEKRIDLQSKSTKELAEEEIRKHASGKISSSSHESVHSQSTKKSELFQKDLKMVDGDIRYTTEEIRLLKEYRRRKDRSYQAQDTRDDGRDERTESKDCTSQKEDEDCSQVQQSNEMLALYKVCLEQNVSSMVNLTSEDSENHEEARRPSYSKSYGKGTNSDFGIQVANVNLKIRDSEVGKELILGDKGQDHLKDSLEGIKIEINVSCTDRNSKGQEHNKRLLFENFRNADDDSLDCPRQLHAKEHDARIDRAYKVAEKSTDDPSEGNRSKNNAVAADRSATLKKGGKGSLEANEEAVSPVASKETYNLTVESQPVTKLLGNSVSGKDTAKVFVDDADTVKSKCAIPNTAIIDANNKILIKKKEDFVNLEGDRLARVQKQGSTSDEKEASGSQTLKSIRKLPEANLVELSSKSLNSLRALDFNFDKLDYRKCSGVTFDRVHVDEAGEFDDGYVRWKKPKNDHIFEDCDMFQSTSGYINPIFSSIDKLEDPHTVPVYTTKDGKISYSPNRRFTYHELMMEARRREGPSNARRSQYADAWTNCCSAKFRKLYKKKRHHTLGDRKKHEYKDTKYLYERKRNYLDEFCGRNHVKCRDYVHGIRSNNPAWAEHGRMYSSSDTDDEIMDRSKNRVPENNYRKYQGIENKPATVSKSQKDEAVEELNPEGTNRAATADVQGKEANILLASVQEHGNKSENAKLNSDVCVAIEKSPSPTKSCDFPHENLLSTEEKRSNDECKVNVDENQSRNVSGNEERLGTSPKLLKNVSSLDENDHRSEDRRSSSCVLEENENNERGVSKETDSAHLEEQKEENDQKIDKSNVQILFVEAEGNSEKTHACIGLEETVDELENYSTAKEISESSKDDSDATEQISEHSLKLEDLRDTSIETAEESPKMHSNETDDEKLEHSEYLKRELQNGELSEEVQSLSEEKKGEEKCDNETQENIESAEFKNTDNLLKDSTRVNDDVNEEESESQIQPDKAIDKEQNSECNPAETIENENSEQGDTVVAIEKTTEQSISEDTVPIENDNNENSVQSEKSEMEAIQPNTEESLAENSAMPLDDLKENSCEDYPDELPNISEHERSLSRDSSVEEDMPVLSIHCTVKDTPDKDAEDKPEEQSEQKEKHCSSVESQQGDHSSEDNEDAKLVPKLVIKKTDTLGSKSEPLDHAESDSSANRYDAKLVSDVRPKIPKMIIMKTMSRSATPTAEILDKPKSEKSQPSQPEQNAPSVDVDNSDSELYTLKYSNYESKVPKVRIKLEDISTKDLKLYLKRKAAKSVPKVKIKKLKRLESEEDSETDSADSDEGDEKGKVPKLKLRKEEDEQSPDRTKAKDAGTLKTPLKKVRKTKEEDGRNDEELKKKLSQCIAEKIPKVIIKRTQIGTEFKCEISSSKKNSLIQTSKWQPKVKLQRLQVLDHMVKDLKQSRIALNVLDAENDELSHDTNTKLFRSSSASSLSPVKCKQRRLSDPDYTKVDMKSINKLLASDFVDVDPKDNKSKSSDSNTAASPKTSSTEGKDSKSKSKKRLFSQSKRSFVIDDSENEKDEVDGKFSNTLSNEDNDLATLKKEYSFFGGKGSTSFIEEKTSSRNFDDNDSIIKVDSSDESQTTIEILPASPDTSDDETKNREFDRSNRLRTEDAMPTQLELELDVIDNRDRQPFLKPKTQEPRNRYFTEVHRSSQSTFNRKKYRSAEEHQHTPEKRSKDAFYGDDALVKEVLAAKETLKKCLTKSENEVPDKSKRHKTAAEKKQGLSFNFKDLGRPSCQPDVARSDHTDDARVHRTPGGTEKKEYKSTRELDLEEVRERCSKQKKVKDESQDGTSCSVDRPTASTCEYTNSPASTIISLKAIKKFGRMVTDEASSVEVSESSNTEGSNRGKTEGKGTNAAQVQRVNDSSSETKTKEDNMPLLVPEIALNFDSSSDRDSSRSPPVITNPDDVDAATEDSKLVESKVITPIEKMEEKKHSYKDCEMTIADIITQLAYHEKATIKHRRYCNLCERWFPTTSRHRRHLAGYQHRYMELTQRKSIHALFILFTGKPCPRLLPANVIRNDCSIGELTPLQIAVQDIAKRAEPTEENLKTKE